MPGVADAIAGAVASANRYPDNRNTDLISALAEHLDIPADRIAIGCGSVALCQEVVSITCLPGDEVIYAWRSFEAYPVVTQVSAAPPPSPCRSPRTTSTTSTRSPPLSPSAPG